MRTWARSVSSKSARAPPVVSSTLSQSASPGSKNNRLPVQVFEGHGDGVWCPCFYPDENKLVSGSKDGTLRIWDRKTGALVKVLTGHRGTPYGVDVSYDGKMVPSATHDKTSCSGSFDETFRVWTVETGQLAFRKPIKCDSWAECVRYSPSEDIRIVSGADTVQIWDASTGVVILSIHNSSVYSPTWTPDGTHIVGGRQGQVIIWDSHSGEPLSIWNTSHNNWIRKLSLSPTGTLLATRAESDNTAFVLNISIGRVVALEHPRNVHGIAYSPLGQFIVTACDDKKVYLWEAPVFQDPKIKSPVPSFSESLPDYSLAGPSQNDGREIGRFREDPGNHPPSDSLNVETHVTSRDSRPRRTLTKFSTPQPTPQQVVPSVEGHLSVLPRPPPAPPMVINRSKAQDPYPSALIVGDSSVNSDTA
ncbi:hypothetical protein PAXRUDRAFT_28723 [Paxillus rubicundulus Ve08.2h10]|uniref:Unplaced genomic scaffold scaffold_1961, whole genome shotgun sequence n=1 Tax=Paxillus rubicundulus Ve08.2h10 TaxID=930991 RepID=A0A0D0C492_9AGAM|nr:hypothetical protein PAXRUDRAFT_28723 [Paxillus rubicundulus Ve08.2h10]